MGSREIHVLCAQVKEVQFIERSPLLELVEVIAGYIVDESGKEVSE